MNQMFTRQARRWVATAAAAALATGFAAAGTASAAAPTTHPSDTVPQGINPTVLPGATPTGTTSSSTPMTVSFILKARNVQELEAKVDAGWQGPYLTTAQFADAYGQPQSVVSALESYLATFGISTSAYADRLDVTATGTAGEFDQALSILLQNYTIPGRAGDKTQHVFATKHDPSFHGNSASLLSKDILSILGLTNYAPFVSTSVAAKGTKVTKPGETKPGQIPAGELTPADFESEYNLTPLTNAGDLGQGQTIGIVTLASLDPTVPEYFWSNLLGESTKPNRITLDNVDGGAGPVSLNAGSDETTLDVEQSGAIAPQSNIVVYQAPNTDYGFVDAFYAAASDNIATSVSASWGESETEIAISVLDGTESPTYAVAFDEAFLEMAAQGQSGFVASGDTGAYLATEDAVTTNLSVDSPADSPYITAGGGTTLPGTQTYAVTNSSGAVTGTESVTIPKQISWSWDYLWPLYQVLGLSSAAEAATTISEGLDTGSGGGYSTIEPRPSYQDGVSGVSSFTDSPFLTPTDVTDTQGIPLPTEFTYNPTPTLGHGFEAQGRAIPDVSFNADPQTGYALYDPQFLPVYGSTIEQFGGTSFVAPQLNGVTAVYASALGRRVGFWNPTIYAAAKSRTSPFTPIDDNQIYTNDFSQTSAAGVTSSLPGTFSNNNLFYTGQKGTVYNPATGLGYANLDALAGTFKAAAEKQR